MPPEPAHRLAYSPIWRPSTTRSGHIPHWLCLLPHGLRSPFRRLRLDERASSGKPKIHPAFLRVRFSGMGSTSSSCSLAYVMLPPSGVNFSSAPPGPRFWPASLMAMDNVLYACRLAEHKLQSGLNLRCNLVRAQTILSQHRLRFSGLSKAVPNPDLGQPVCPLTFKSIAYGIAQAANNAMLLDAEQLCAGCRISAYKVRIHGLNGM